MLRILQLTLATLSLVILAGCASVMTPEQHQQFARDSAMLTLCDDAGLLSPQLASEAVNLYRFRINNYIVDNDVLDKHYNHYMQQFNGKITRADCSSYARQVQGEIFDRQRAVENADAFMQAISGLSNAYATGMQQRAQAYHEAATGIALMGTPQIQPIQPLYNIGPTRTNCITVGSGMVSCQTQ
ncbi:hypothetical protein ACFBZI_02655 [Moraxella sp. ZJ142]|uniref:hypothetical protein n=1 Tax=Moraxella marmotae TaxID=3344520 RepID=UPI0035D41F09